MDETFSLPVEAACFDDLTNATQRELLADRETLTVCSNFFRFWDVCR
jgi:hypothetical protein